MKEFFVISYIDVEGQNDCVCELMDEIIDTLDQHIFEPRKKWYNYLSHLDLKKNRNGNTCSYTDANGAVFAFLNIVYHREKCKLIVNIFSDDKNDKVTIAANAAKGLVKSCISLRGLNFTQNDIR